MNAEEATLEKPFGDVPEGHRSGFVTVIGRPNAGKSTLLNAFLRDKIAIVTPRPQTTRTRQLGILTGTNYQIIFVDTPGIIRQARHKLDEFMMETAQESMTDADVVLWLVDTSQQPGPEDQAIGAHMVALSKNRPVILVMNKADLLAPDQVLTRSQAFRSLLPDAPWILLSATRGDGVAELQQMIVAALPEGPRYYPPDQVTDTFVRDLAAELIREQVMLQLRDEIPYGVVVVVESFKERPNGTTYVGANLFVEREAHKRIVIGAGGSQLKRIGAAARREIEALVEGKVFLELWVKVAPRWRRDAKALRRFGYHTDR